jgi:hypothetical protein
MDTATPLPNRLTPRLSRHKSEKQALDDKDEDDDDDDDDEAKSRSPDAEARLGASGPE